MSRVAQRQEAAMRWAWRELETRGRSVKTVKIGPDGSIALLTESEADDLASPDNDWVTFAGETALPRA